MNDLKQQIIEKLHKGVGVVPTFEEGMTKAECYFKFAIQGNNKKPIKLCLDCSSFEVLLKGKYLEECIAEINRGNSILFKVDAPLNGAIPVGYFVQVTS